MTKIGFFDEPSLIKRQVGTTHEIMIATITDTHTRRMLVKHLQDKGYLAMDRGAEVSWLRATKEKVTA